MEYLASRIFAILDYFTSVPNNPYIRNGFILLIMLEISIRLIWVNVNNHFIPSKHTGERNFRYDMCDKAPHVSVTKLPPKVKLTVLSHING